MPVNPFFGTLLLTSIAAGALGQPHGFREGEAVPDLVLPSAEGGSPMRLADFRGQKIVLHVFASW